MSVTVLGSGKSNVGSVFRNTAAHLVTTDDAKILLDCSDGTRGQLAKLNLNSLAIDAIFFSHFHPDHFSPNCLLQDYLVKRYESPDTLLKLQLYGPKGLTERLVATWDMFYGKDKFQTIMIEQCGIEVYELDDRETVRIDSMIVTAHKVQHGGREAFAYRITSGDEILTYSGDSNDCAGLREAARESNLFLCEAALPVDGPSSNDAHVSAKGAATIATEVNVSELVLTHYSISPDVMLAAVKETAFTGRVTVADDLSQFSISPR